MLQQSYHCCIKHGLAQSFLNTFLICAGVSEFSVPLRVSLPERISCKEQSSHCACAVEVPLQTFGLTDLAQADSLPYTHVLNTSRCIVHCRAWDCSALDIPDQEFPTAAASDVFFPQRPSWYVSRAHRQAPRHVSSLCAPIVVLSSFDPGYDGRLSCLQHQMSCMS